MRRRKRRRGGKEEVELNLAAMLDMAFQLLTFFILTFRPAPIEGQVNLRLPPPVPATRVVGGQSAGNNQDNNAPLQGLTTLAITVFSNAEGRVKQIVVAGDPMGSVAALDGKLERLLSDPGNGFDQLLVQVGSKLHYDDLMKVVDVCTRQKLPSGEKLSKLSFQELPE